MIDPAMLKEGNADLILSSANLPAVTAQAAKDALGPNGSGLISPNSWLELCKAIKADPSILDQKVEITVPAATGIDLAAKGEGSAKDERSEEHTSELQSLMRISYAVFCLKKKKTYKRNKNTRRKHKRQQHRY